ncbi:nuclear transport factor 2 family protein [Agromyces seonyuensis]|uniref:SnoaL-like domain-containing protein n=1 Tax=Agromyces seonyuensis TaxID=2662446 RepID=A0A6I4NZT5_9MICO|nr:nuclear transport factor 2 family protein [Agromyces seonyuensis]MWB98752.1 hypothetical protein [Agromyces seonyuensis]
MTSERTAAWMAGYLRAWSSNDPEDIARLFTDDAQYLTEPDAEPRIGRDEIVEGWIGDLDEPGTWTFEWGTVVETDTTAVVQGRTGYEDRADYLNLWVIRFAADGRATEFTEWYLPRPKDE